MVSSKKIKSIIKPDWTSMGTKSKPFYQPASGSFSERYSVTVLSRYSTTGGQQLETRMDACKEPGLTRLLKYYSKISSGSIANQVFTEDYYISERPKAKMKVLISLPCTSLEALPDQVDQTQLENLGPPTAEISLNTYDLETKIEIALSLLSKYQAEIERFYGRVYDIDFGLETTRLQSFIPALTNFLRENEMNYSSESSDLITLYINDHYKVLMTKINKGGRYVDLIKGYSNFIENPSINNDRTIFLLSKLDEMEKVSILNKPLSWSKFLKNYIYRPPSIDFSKPPPHSHTLEHKVQKELEKNERQPAQTLGEVWAFNSWLRDPAVREELQDFTDDAHAFIGDEILARLDKVSSMTKDMESIYDNFFNKLGLDGLLNSAIQCLDMPEIGIFSIPTNILDTLTAASKAIQSIFNPPTMEFPSDYSVVDFMGDMILKMLVGLLDTMVSMLITMIIEIIKSLFDFCNECAVTDSEGNKDFSNLSFGESSFTGLIGGALSAGFKAQGPKILLGSAYNAMQDTPAGDVELLSQSVLKNTIRSRERIFEMEAEEIYAKYQSGELAKPLRILLQEKIEELFGQQWTAELGNVSVDYRADFFGSAEVTVDKIRILLKNDEPWDTDVFKDAAEEVAEYLEMSSTVLSAGEIGNTLLGCDVGDEAKEVMRNTLSDFPNLFGLLADPDDDDEKTDNNIAGLWSGFSNILPQKAIMQQVTDAISLTPEKFQCLCDADDTALREELLRKKDPQMSPDQRRDQVKKSKARKRDRLKDLANLMGKDDILAGLIPPLVCSGSYDEQGKPVVTQGILPTTHPVTEFMVKQTLDTVYDPLHTTFTRDLAGMLPAMSQKPLLKEQVPRTVMATINGEDIRIMNMKFVDMVQQGSVAYGSLQNSSIVPGSKKPPDEDFDPESAQEDGYRGEELWEYNEFMAWLGFDAFSNPQAMGMWEQGQTRPTPEQEYSWELKNMRTTQSYDADGNLIGTKIGGGRNFNEEKNTYLGYKYNEPKWWQVGATNGTRPEYANTLTDYVKSYGYSPIPVETYKYGDLTYAPGLKQSYVDMCEDFKVINTDTQVGSKTFNIRDIANSTHYRFILPNVMNAFGLDFAEMSKGLASISGEIMNVMGSSGASVDADPLRDISTQLDSIAASSFNFVYNVRNDDGTNNIQKDRFSLDFQIAPPVGGTASAALMKEVGLAGPMVEIPINAQAEKVIERKNLEVALKPNQPQEGYFYDFAKYSWLEGNTIYRNGEALLPKNIPDSLKTGILAGGNVNSFLSFLHDETAYKNLFGDLFCAFTSQISESPYLNLKPDAEGRGLSNLRLSPPKIVGNAPLCYRTLLDVDLIKKKILDEYNYIKCFKEAFKIHGLDSDTTGLVGNKDTPFEISNRAGCILLTIRLYVLEFLLRTIYVFHYFVLGDGAEIDAASINYLYIQIIDGIARRSIGTRYYEEFQKETVELYNRNNKETQLYDENKKLRYNAAANPKYTDFKTAIEFFIKNQLYSVSRRLSKHVQLKGDGSPHSILLEKWLPAVDPPRFKGDVRFADVAPDGNLRNKPLGNYMEAANIPVITDELFSSVQSGGTLTNKRIASIRAGSGKSEGLWGMVYLGETGQYFREYFQPNAQIPAVRNLLQPYESNSQMAEKAKAMKNSIWPANNATGGGLIKTGDPAFGLNFAFREAHLLGYQHAPYAGIYNGGLPSLNPRYDSTYMGFLGLAGFPWNNAANVAEQHVVVTTPARTTTKPVPVTTEQTIDNNAFPFGVSLAEQQAMTGDGNTIPGGFIRFIEAAKNWTLGPIPSSTRNSSNWSQYDDGTSGTPRTTDGFGPGKYVIYEPEFMPWWWDYRWKKTGQTPANNPNRINFLQSGRFYGPGSLLWAMSRARPPAADDPEVLGDRTTGGNGVGAFGLVNDINYWYNSPQNRGQLPAPYGNASKGQLFCQGYTSSHLRVAGVANMGAPIPFLLDWHNYVLGKTGSPGVGDRTDYTVGSGGYSRNAETPMARVATNPPQMPYISLLDLDLKAVIRTLEWEQLQYQNWADDMDLTNEWRDNPDDRHEADSDYPQTLNYKSYTLRVLAEGARDRNVHPASNGGSFSDATKLASRTALYTFANQSTLNQAHYRRIAAQYDIWIEEMQEIHARFDDSEEQRKCMAQPARDLIANGRMERNEMRVSPTLDVSNGNIILEPYIRVEDYEDDPNLQPNIDYVKFRGSDGWAGVRRVYWDQDDVYATNMLKGVVNIDIFDGFMGVAFGPNVNQGDIPSGKAGQQRVNAQAIIDEDCGDGLPNRQGDFGERLVDGDTGVSPGYVANKPQLRDFFKSLHFGLRVSYLSTPGEWTGHTNVPNTQKPFSKLDQKAVSLNNATKEKTYYMVENAATLAAAPNQVSRSIYSTPLTSVEVPINMYTLIEDLFPANGFKKMTPGNLTTGVCGGPGERGDDIEVDLAIGYFRHLFGTPREDASGHAIALSSPNNALQKQLVQTDEYAFLFKYALSLDRMLSLTNLYGATYLSSLPDMNNLFAPTKENLMYIFINSLNSGKWKDACQTGNKDLLDALMNGIDVPWAQLLIMILKFPLKIFKAYEEMSDLNIAISINIKKVIKMLNAIIATAQRQANAAKQAAEAAAAAVERIAGMRVVEEDCGFGIHSPESTQKPPDDWFKPIDETFLYEPETWMIGLALLPFNIFGPYLWGPPLTSGRFNGILYWVMDDSHVNWLDAYFKKFEKWLYDNKDNLPPEILDEPCDIDYNLEFGLADDLVDQQRPGMPSGLEGYQQQFGGGNTNDGGTGGSSGGSY